MQVRQRTQEIERQTLSEFATLSEHTQGRESFEEECPLRTSFQRDRDRVIHSKAFRRLRQKTQVFLSPAKDHYRTRLTHTLEVSQIARTISRALRLNEDLAEAIALGHDLGHTPFGHAGERALDELNPQGFKHFKQSVRVVTCLEKNHKGLNLTNEVLDGVLHHTHGAWASTLEGCVVRYADRIAYMNHDIEDAVLAGVLIPDDLPQDVIKILGNSKSERITTLITSLVENTRGNKLLMSPEVEEQYKALHKFMYATVYVDPVAKEEEGKVAGVLEALYEYFCKKPNNLPEFYRDIVKDEGKDRAVTDYISGMSDDYAVIMYEELFVPKKWSI